MICSKRQSLRPILVIDWRSETQQRFADRTGERGNQEGAKPKMIYRKWSLLTGPTAILGGIVVSLAVANLIFVKEDPFLKPKERKVEPATK